MTFLLCVDTYFKNLVAFANTAGGVLIIGKDDKGSISGSQDVFHAEEKLASTISETELQELKKKGLVTTIGKGPTTRWILVEP